MGTMEVLKIRQLSDDAAHSMITAFMQEEYESSPSGGGVLEQLSRIEQSLCGIDILPPVQNVKDVTTDGNLVSDTPALTREVDSQDDYLENNNADGRQEHIEDVPAIKMNLDKEQRNKLKKAKRKEEQKEKLAKRLSNKNK